MVQSIALLKKNKINLLIGGGQGKKEVKTLAKKLGIIDQTHFIPPAYFTKIPAFIAAADIIILPFFYNPTTSRSLLEAMAMGKPIITTPVGEIKNMLKHKTHALLVNNQPKNIAKAINLLLKNKSLAIKLSSQAQKLILRKYSLNKIINYHLKCYIIKQ